MEGATSASTLCHRKGKAELLGRIDTHIMVYPRVTICFMLDSESYGQGSHALTGSCAYE